MRIVVFFLLCCSAISFAQNKAPAAPGIDLGMHRRTIPTKGLRAPSVAPQAVLDWSESGCSTCTFNVYRGASAGTETLLTSGVTTLTYTDTTVIRGNFYCYEVTAVDSAGESPKSNEMCGTDPAVPSAPTGLTVTFQ